MKNIKLLSFSLLAAVAAAVGSRGEPLRTDINPALLYFQASQVAPDFSPADRDYLFNAEWRGQKLQARFGELVARWNNEFALVRQAARATVPCEWGIDWSKGPGTLLPHLSRNRAVAQAARLRVMWFLQNGQQAEAVDDLLAAFALARNSSRDGSLIALLVQIAMENMLCTTVAENVYQLSPESLKQLAEAFDAAPTRLTVAACIQIEKSSFPDWMLARLQQLQKENPGNETKVMESIREFFDGSTGDEGANDATRWPRIQAAAGGTTSGMVKLIVDAESLYPRLAQVLALPRPQYEEQMEQFNAEIQRSPNPFVSELFPSWAKCQTKEYAVLTQLAMVRAGLEYKLRGESGLKSVTDPCGQGPFAFERFVFEGVDRGFELKAAYDGRGFQEALIFVEKDGPPFQVTGRNIGQPAAKSVGAK
jgi:hypothetical protein